MSDEINGMAAFIDLVRRTRGAVLLYTWAPATGERLELWGEDPMDNPDRVRHATLWLGAGRDQLDPEGIVAQFSAAGVELVTAGPEDHDIPDFTMAWRVRR